MDQLFKSWIEALDYLNNTNNTGPSYFEVLSWADSTRQTLIDNGYAEQVAERLNK